jgi:acyl carrier protein
MDETQVLAGLSDIFQDVFDDDSIVLTPDVTPSEIPWWDSARYITLVVATESRFGIRFEPAELESMRTVRDFVRRIHGKLEQTTAA